jgi:hypothetical protein
MSSTNCCNLKNCANLPTPQSCTSSQGLRDINLTDKHKPYTFNNNVANINIPFTGKEKEHSKGLAAQQEPVPENWNWIENDPDIINRGTYNQGQCGSCWSFSVAMVLSDMYAIKYNMKNPKLSPLWLLTCANNVNSGLIETNDNIKVNISSFPSDNSLGCCGGNNYVAAKWLEDNKKIGTMECWPITGFNNSLYNNGSIVEECLEDIEQNIKCLNCDYVNNEKFTSTEFGVKKGSTKFLVDYNCDRFTGEAKINTAQTIINIKRQIMLGPVMSNMRVPADFQEWWSKPGTQNEIYKNNLNLDINSVGGHAVSLVGWGKSDDNEEYWIMRNSWGETHGTEYDNDGNVANPGIGYCKIAITNKNDDPKTYMGLDIPIIQQGDTNCEPIGWIGGSVSIEADELPSAWQNMANTAKLKMKPSGTGAQDFGEGNNSVLKFNNILDHFKKYWYIYLILGVIVILLIILASILH